MSTTTSSTNMQRYSEELSEYTFRQFCLASALLEIKDDETMPHLLPEHRRLACQVNQIFTQSTQPEKHKQHGYGYF
jgi:hypothetical protein